MGLMTFKGGVHPFEGKDLSKDKPIRELLPKGELVYPLSQHIGAPATPIVAVGDTVLKGQKIAEAENRDAIEKAQESLKLSSAQMFSEASSAYWNYDAKMEGYQNNISDARAELTEALTSLKDQYDTNVRHIDQNIKDAEIAKDRADYNFWDGLLDVLSFGVAASVDAYTDYENNKLQYQTATSYENLTNYLKESNI